MKKQNYFVPVSRLPTFRIADEVNIYIHNQELEDELKVKVTALDNLTAQIDRLTNSRERETEEGGNLLGMLRDDLERLSNER